MCDAHVPILPSLLWCAIDAGVEHLANNKAVKLLAEHLHDGKEIPFTAGVLLNQVCNKLDLLSIEGKAIILDNFSESMKTYAA
jgi:hypothetical protein